jgi:menaquinone-dependent protoporphyrinogen oxidase
MKKILIAYVSKTGSTKEVAMEIGKVLTEKGLSVDVIPVSEVKSVEFYSGVVIGAPVNGMRWHQDANDFIQANSEKFKTIPAAYFLLSAALLGSSNFFKKKIPNCLAFSKALVKPVKEGIFGGYMPGEPPFIIRLIFGLKKDSKMDGRDWNVIRSWSNELASSFL